MSMSGSNFIKILVVYVTAAGGFFGDGAEAGAAAGAGRFREHGGVFIFTLKLYIFCRRGRRRCHIYF